MNKQPLMRAVRPLFFLALVIVLTGCEDNVEYACAKDHGIAYLYWIAFTAGIATSLTPCVYPMIPITMSVFGAKAGTVSKGKAFALAAAYVLGMAALFTPMGMGFALAGSKTGFGQLLNEWYVIVPLCLMFVAFAVSLFGVFDIRLPYKWQDKLNSMGGDGFRGAFLMGLVGGLIAAPCVGPFAGSMLTAIASNAESGDYASAVFEGGTTMFFYALGIGVLFMFVAVVSMRGMPQSGQWMEWVKSVFGVALLAVTIYYLRPLIPAIDDAVRGTTQYQLMCGILIVAGIGIGAIHLSFHGSTSQKLRKGAGILLTVAGSAGLFLSTKAAAPPPEVAKDQVIVAIKDNGKVSLPQDPTKIEEEKRTPQQAQHAADVLALRALAKKTFAASKKAGKTEPEARLDAAFAVAASTNKGVVLDFWATWCGPCKEIDKVINTKAVYPRIGQEYVFVKIDLSDPSDAEEALKDKFKAKTLPAVLFLDSAGQKREEIRGHAPSEGEMLALLDRARDPSSVLKTAQCEK